MGYLKSVFLLGGKKTFINSVYCITKPAGAFVGKLKKAKRAVCELRLEY